MRKLKLLLTLSLVYSASHGQYLTYSRYEFLNKSQLQVNTSIENQYEDVKGDAFYSTQWLPGKVTTAQGQQYSDLKLKIDIYANKLYAKIHDTIFDLTGTAITSCQLFQTYSNPAPEAVFKKGVSIPGAKPDQLFRVLAEGSLTLLKRQVLEIKEVHDDGILSTSRKFIETNDYFLVKKDGSAEMIRLNKSNLQQQAGDKWKDVSAYLKANDLSASSEDGWIAAISYCNTH